MTDWLTAPQLCELLGIARISSKALAKCERKGRPRAYLYRLLPKQAPQLKNRGTSSCASCDVALTPNRIWKISGVALCSSCAKRVTVGGDTDLAKRLKL